MVIIHSREGAGMSYFGDIGSIVSVDAGFSEVARPTVP